MLLISIRVAFGERDSAGIYNRGESQTLAGVIPFCGGYPGPRFEDRPSKWMEFQKLAEVKWLPVNFRRCDVTSFRSN